MSVQQDQGYDSFLDIVANLVGILIILVVVVGAHARSSWTRSPRPVPEESQVAQLKLELDESRNESRSLFMDRAEIQANIANQMQQIESLDRRRHAMLVQMDLVQSEIDARLAKQSDAKRIAFEKRAQLDELKRQYVSLEKQMAATKVQQSRVEKIEHYPTPIARTVFSDEVHFQLKAGRLAHVPLDDLIRQMKSEWKVTAARLGQAPDTVSTVGPIDGFRLQYQLSLRQETFSTPSGDIRREVPEFDHFVVMPFRDDLGEPVAEALSEHSQLAQRLARQDPHKTTVSIWVYPDSYEELMQLKTWLRQNGFQIATWPLKQEGYISGGPNGFRAAAQ